MNENEIRQALGSVEDAFKQEGSYSYTNLMYKVEFDDARAKYIKPIPESPCSEGEWKLRLDTRRDQIHQLWGHLDHFLGASVCNGTADGFPDRKLPVSTHSWGSQKEQLFLDYFQELKECLRRIKETKPKDGSLCYDLLYPIYWVTPASLVKQKGLFSKLLHPLLGCGVTGLFLLLVNWISQYAGKSLLPTLLTPILVIAGLILSAVMAIWMIVGFVSFVKEAANRRRLSRYRSRMRKQCGGIARNNLTNAKTLLAYFQKWAARTGTQTPEAVTEMADIIRGYENSIR